MITPIQVQSGKRTVTAYELTLFAFKTPKGIFTLSGTNSDGTDEWRQLGTCNFHTWERSSVYQWLKLGKIKPIQEAIEPNWRLHTINKK